MRIPIELHDGICLNHNTQRQSKFLQPNNTICFVLVAEVDPLNVERDNTINPRKLALNAFFLFYTQNPVRIRIHHYNVVIKTPMRINKPSWLSCVSGSAASIGSRAFGNGANPIRGQPKSMSVSNQKMFSKITPLPGR